MFDKLSQQNIRSIQDFISPGEWTLSPGESTLGPDESTFFFGFCVAIDWSLIGRYQSIPINYRKYLCISHTRV